MRDLSCRDVIDVLMDYADGVLPPEERASVEAHLAGCPPCVDFARSYRETPRLFRQATEASMPPEMERRLQRFLEERGRS